MINNTKRPAMLLTGYPCELEFKVSNALSTTADDDEFYSTSQVHLQLLDQDGLLIEESVCDGRDSWTCKVYDGDTVIDSYMVYESPLEIKKKEVSDAFDLHFERMWRAKGYTSFDDLNSHAANQNSKYHEEALMLIEWSHEQWELAIHNIDENSNVEQIIKLLPDI